jgi:hypothetical protein
MSLAILAAVLLSQNPFVVAPDDYKLELENEYLRIVRVTYGPHQKSPVHDHPANPTVYVYTTDGDKMRISHEDGPVVERPVVKAGQVRFNHGMPEHHTMENLGDARSEYIRLELKTQAVDLPAKDVRLGVGDGEFENGMLKISRSVTAGPEPNPCVYVVIGSGKAVFVGAGERYRGAGDERLVRVELKTGPGQSGA